MDKKIKNEKKLKAKKFPEIIKLSLFLCLLGVFSGGLLALVNEYTEKVIDENAQKAVFEEIKSVGIVEESLSKIEEIHTDEIQAIYRAQTTDKVSCYVFVAEAENAFTTVKTIIIVESESKKVRNIKVLPSSTTHGKDELLENSDFGMIGQNIDSLNDNFKVVTQASISSGSVKECLLAVYNELSMIIGNIVFESVKQCLPKINNYEYTFEVDDEKVTLLLQYNENTKKFEYLETLLGKIKDDAIDECLGLANVNFPKEYIKTVYNDANGTVLTVVTDKGYKGVMVAEIKINNDNKIIGFTLKESQETYESEKNDKYTYEEKVEDIIFKDYLLGIKDKEVTGATVTSKAINQLLLMAENYISSLGGTRNG